VPKNLPKDVEVAAIAAARGAVQQVEPNRQSLRSGEFAIHPG
jgi:hypothetical protein